MALSEEQKQRNKVANRLRDKAYKARCDALNAALERARSHPDVLRIKNEAEMASDDVSAKIDHLVEAEKALREQIAKLERQVADLRDARNSPPMRDLQERRKALYAQYLEAEREQERCARAQYPDLINLYGVAGWAPPPEVQAQIDAIKSGEIAVG